MINWSRCKHPFYITNFLLIFVYPLTRFFHLKVMIQMSRLADIYGNTQETSVMYLLVIILVTKYFKSYSFQHYAAEAFFLGQISIILLYVLVDIQISLWYIFFCIVLWLSVEQPQFSGKSQFIRIKSKEDFQKELTNKLVKSVENDATLSLHPEIFENQTHCFVEFYTDWADICKFVNLNPFPSYNNTFLLLIIIWEFLTFLMQTQTQCIWAQYSSQFTTQQFKFVEVNVTKFPELAQTYRINTSAISRQLPTLIMFENGKEVLRFPPIEEKTGKVPQVLQYDKKSLSHYFDLERRYLATRDY